MKGVEFLDDDTATEHRFLLRLELLALDRWPVECERKCFAFTRPAVVLDVDSTVLFVERVIGALAHFAGAAADDSHVRDVVRSDGKPFTFRDRSDTRRGALGGRLAGIGELGCQLDEPFLVCISLVEQERVSLMADVWLLIVYEARAIRRARSRDEVARRGVREFLDVSSVVEASLCGQLPKKTRGEFFMSFDVVDSDIFLGHGLFLSWVARRWRRRFFSYTEPNEMTG